MSAALPLSTSDRGNQEPLVREGRSLVEQASIQSKSLWENNSAVDTIRPLAYWFGGNQQEIVTIIDIIRIVCRRTQRSLSGAEQSRTTTMYRGV